MNKYNEVLFVSEEIDGEIKSLNNEMSSLEIYLKMNKINILKKENEELEKIIELHKKELGELEIANGKRDIQPPIKMQVKEVTLHEENSKKEPVILISKNKSASIKQDRKAQKKEIQKEEKSTIPKGGSGKKSVAVEETLPIDIGRLDLKVGKILQIQRHKDADTLYVEKVDIGAREPITVVSGLVKHVPIEEMENRLVVVLCNLKTAKMRGITSEAMVMCACTPDKVEVLSPSSASKPGDVVTVPGYPPPPNGPEPVLNPKKKVFEILAPELVTDSECFATFRGVRWEVPGGYVRSSTLCGVNIK